MTRHWRQSFTANNLNLFTDQKFVDQVSFRFYFCQSIKSQWNWIRCLVLIVSNITCSSEWVQLNVQSRLCLSDIEMKEEKKTFQKLQHLHSCIFSTYNYNQCHCFRDFIQKYGVLKKYNFHGTIYSDFQWLNCFYHEYCFVFSTHQPNKSLLKLSKIDFNRCFSITSIYTR